MKYFRLLGMKIIKYLIGKLTSKKEIDHIITGGNPMCVNLDEYDVRQLIKEFGNKK